MMSTLNRQVSVILTLCLFSCLSPFFLQAQSFDLRLENGLAKPIAPHESHEYTLSLNQDELLFVRFDQEGADISIKVQDPTGKLVEEFDGNNGKQGPELVHINPKLSGKYVLVVQPLAEQKKEGSYTVKIDRHVKNIQNPSDRLDQMIGYWAEQEYLPGFAVAVLDKNTVHFQKAYGYSNLERKLPYTLETIQNIGSVSKTLIGISIMKAVEDGKLSLGSNINDFLPFEVRNPYYPDQAITLKHLATHTSSIAEMPAYEQSYILKEAFTYKKGEINQGEFSDMKLYSQNKEKSLDEFLRSILSAQGSLYKKKHFLKQAPGEKYSYSNAAATLAAYIIALVYEMPYDAFTQKYILNPLEMKDSGWSFDEIALEKHSDLHFFNYKPIPKYTLITYPDGGLLTNILDMSRYLQSQMKGYYGEDQLLTADSYQQMMSPKLAEKQKAHPKRNYGYFWEFTQNDIGHNGGDPGAVCFIRFTPETGMGRIIMTNILPATPMAGKAFQSIWKYLKEMGEELTLQHAKN